MFESINPATGVAVARYPTMDANTVDAVLGATAAAARAWAGVDVAKRAARLERVATVLEARKDEFALLMTREMGKPIRQARAEVAKCATLCRYYSSRGPAFLAEGAVESDATESYLVYQPLGVVLGIMPWNFPFWQVLRFAAPALTAGNGALLKHASNVSGCALALESLFRQAGYPEDLFRTLLIPSDTVAGLIADPRIQAVTLTGSERAGAAVAAAAGKAIKKTVLELGGSDPYLILEDADLDHAAEKCVESRLINSGQSCIAAKRFIVDRRVAEEFTHKFVAGMKRRVLGKPEDDATDIGPQARGDLRDSLHDQVRRSVQAGAKCLLGGKISKRAGYYYPATVLTGVRPGMAIFDEEVFGPVAAIIEAADVEDAIQLANQSAYGLGSAVFSRDVDRAKSVALRLEAGGCFINDFVKSDPRLPFGGIKRSGYGRELSVLGIREFVNIKTISVS